MPQYRWSCHACSTANPPGEVACTQCGFPAEAEGKLIERALEARANGVPLSPASIHDSRTGLQKLTDSILASELRIAGLALALAAIAVVAVSWGRYNNTEFLDGIRVEAHGMLMDIVVIGMFILWLNQKRDAKERARRYAEEIDDYREWHSGEASHRISGAIRRLNSMGREFIFLSRCYLRRANLKEIRLVRSPMHQVDLGESSLRNARLLEIDLDTAFIGYADLRGASFERCNMPRVRLMHSKAHGTNFRGSNLRKASFNGALLRGADLRDCVLADCVFDGADFGGADFRGATGLDVNGLKRAHSLAYARFDADIEAALKQVCPELLNKNRRRTKLPPLRRPPAGTTTAELEVSAAPPAARSDA
ncbi:MAG: hypothetical protein CVU22_06730 [Betaproteobacteria bacterium HGW-Betaproteobacteria-16]|nr:MAG: hypothetical protein CVU22_06730 [Betaproteobacteria bacterium HGW-Betaproteobacteria-16]